MDGSNTPKQIGNLNLSMISYHWFCIIISGTASTPLLMFDMITTNQIIKPANGIVNKKILRKIDSTILTFIICS